MLTSGLEEAWKVYSPMGNTGHPGEGWVFECISANVCAWPSEYECSSSELSAWSSDCFTFPDQVLMAIQSPPCRARLLIHPIPRLSLPLPQIFVLTCQVLLQYICSILLSV